MSRFNGELREGLSIFSDGSKISKARTRKGLNDLCKWLAQGERSKIKPLKEICILKDPTVLFNGSKAIKKAIPKHHQAPSRFYFPNDNVSGKYSKLLEKQALIHFTPAFVRYSGRWSYTTQSFSQNLMLRSYIRERLNDVVSKKFFNLTRYHNRRDDVFRANNLMLIAAARKLGYKFSLPESVDYLTEHFIIFTNPWLANVILVPRPSESHSENDVFNNDEGPAVIWPNGKGVNFVRGQFISEYAIANAHNGVLKGRSTFEIQGYFSRIMDMSKFGPAAIKGRGRLVDKTDRGRLYRYQMQSDVEGLWWRTPSWHRIVFLQVTNASPEPDGHYEEFFIRVPPNIQSVRHALAWTWGIRTAEYGPTVET